MNKWGNPDKSPNNFIFPVLSDGISAHRKRELIQGFIRLINDWMKIITSNLGIKKKVRTMEYRHSMATVLKRAGVSSEFIRETLGHNDLRTTENYLDSLKLALKRNMQIIYCHLKTFKPFLKIIHRHNSN